MRTLTTPSRFLHWMIVGSFALVGLGLLVIMLWILMVEEEQMAILALIFTAPVWLVGLVAAAEVVRLLRSRNDLTERRAGAWAAISFIGGVLVAHFTGLFALIATLITRPGDVGLNWPVIMLGDGQGGWHYHYLDGWGLGILWPTVWLILGASALCVLVLRRVSSATGAEPAL